MRTEQTILLNLLTNDEYFKQVLPYLSDEYFKDSTELYIYNKIKDFADKYNKQPTKEVLLIEVENDNVSESVYTGLQEILNQKEIEERNIEWLISITEEFCQDKAILNSITTAISILDGSNDTLDKGAIPGLLQDALGISFDDHIGHDFFRNALERFDFYKMVEERVPFALESFNKITRGGLPNKSLNVIIAGVGVGKSLTMCDWASSNLCAGKNVLYITLEMAEERIAERIDANLLNIPIDELAHIPKEVFGDKIVRLKKKSQGTLIIKEYPTASASVGNFRSLLNELKLKREFKPDIIYVDYLNICASYRIKLGRAGMYEYVKAIAEELRGLAVENNVPVVTATQLNRSGFTNSDPGMDDTSESFGLPATADFMIAAITSEQLEEMNHIMWKQLKNRYKDLKDYRRFVTGVDKPKMRLYDVEQPTGDEYTKPDDDAPLFDKSDFGKRDKGRPDLSKLNF
jgi:replicative DNA helicase